jgi:nucleotide-binding universal stress UspA family protein
MVAIVTSIMAPPLLRWTVPKIEMNDEERERLEREADAEQSFVANIKRVLIPTRCSVDSQFAAKLVGYLVRDEEIEVTSMYLERSAKSADRSQGGGLGRRVRELLTDGGSSGDPAGDGARSVGERDGEDDDAFGPGPLGGTDDADGTGVPLREDEDRCFDAMAAQLSLDGGADLRSITRVEETNATQTVLAEAEQGYDLLILGASERGARASDPLFGAIVDDIIVNAPCPVMVVNTHDSPEVLEEGNEVNRILLPTAGTEYNRHAAEVAFAMARDREAIVDIVHYVDPSTRGDRYVDRPDVHTLVEFGEEIVDQTADRGRKMGAKVNTHVLVAESEPEEEILQLAEELDHDLIMMGTNLRPVTQRAFFGHRVEYIIKNASCPVAVLSSV